MRRHCFFPMASDELERDLDRKLLPQDRDTVAPDGSEIRLLTATSRGSMVHCTLSPGAVSKPVAHRTVEEVWYFLEGAGQMWRRQGDEERVVDVGPGVSLSIAVGVHFQFRADRRRSPARFVVVTMPPWPDEDETYAVPGPWTTEG